MPASPALPGSPDELHPQLLFRSEEGHARFATWRLAAGPESLALFTTAEKAGQYRAELAESESWTIYQPPRDKLVAILEACQATGIHHAALDPLAGGARTLFDIPQVLAASRAAGAG